MKNEIFEKIKTEFNLKNDVNFKLYCDAIWNVYEECNPNEFEKTIQNFIKKFDKAYDLFLCDTIINFTDYRIDNIFFEKILKTTTWINITSPKDGKFDIIDPEKIYSFSTEEKEEYDVYILEDLPLFNRICGYYSIHILK